MAAVVAHENQEEWVECTLYAVNHMWFATVLKS